MGPRPLQAARAAVDHAHDLLVRRFEPRRWLGLAVIAWMATLGGGGTRLNLPGVAGPGVGLPVVDERWGSMTAWLALVYAVAVLVGLFVVATWVLTAWINSRAAFAFVDAVAGGHGRLGEGWARYWRPARSLFWFRLVTGGALGLVLAVPLGLGVLGMAAWASSDRGTELLAPVGLALSVAWACGAVGLGSMHRVMLSVVDDLVVPVMYARECGLFRGIAQVGGVAARWPLAFLGYGLIRAGAGLVAAGVMGAVGLLCGLGWIPMLDVLLVLPVLVALRAVGLCFLAELGGGLEVLRRW